MGLFATRLRLKGLARGQSALTGRGRVRYIAADGAVMLLTDEDNGALLRISRE